MKNQDKKILLFVIATVVTSFGIGYTLLKDTYASFSNVTGGLTGSYNVNYLSNWPLEDYEEEIQKSNVITTHVVLGSLFTAPSGYTFDSWNTSQDGTGTKYVENDNIFLSNDVTLYAQWQLLSVDETDIDDNLDDGITDEDIVEDVNNSFEEIFDDINFYRCVVDSYNLENYTEYDYTSYSLSEEELADITILSCSGLDVEDSKKITSTKGIEKLVSLKVLNLSYNLLTEIDLSQNIELTYLDIGADLIAYDPYVIRNQIKEIDLSNNTKLTDLNLGGNELTKIDLSKNTLLKELDVSSNKLTELNLNNNLQLSSLIAYSNELVNIDLSKNTLLFQIDLTENNLESIDLSQNIDLEYLWIGTNKLKELDLSNNSVLDHLECSYNMFGNEYYVYKNDSIMLNSNLIKFPTSFDTSEYIWKSSDEKIAIVDEKGVVSTKNSGSVQINYWLITNTINVVELYSSKYIIGDSNIYILDDNIQEIKDNLKLSHEDVEIFISDDITYLQLKYNNKIIKEFKLLDANIINTIEVGTTMNDIKIDVVGNFNIFDRDDNLIEDVNRKLKSGDKFKFNLSGETLIYSISVLGDVDGDGNITREDIELSSKHIIHGNLITGVEYLKAIDMDNNDTTNINDIIKMVKQVKVSD